MYGFSLYLESPNISTMKSLVLALIIGVGQCFVMDTLVDERKVSLDDQRSSVNISVSDSIVGAFDFLTDVTKDTGGLFDEFEDGFDSIHPTNDTEEYSLLDEDLNINGSTIVMGLFDSVRGATKLAGKVIKVVGNKLMDRREEVVELASNVETEVGNIGDNVGQVVVDIGTNVGAIHQGASNTLWSWLNPIKSFKESLIHRLTGGSSQWR